MSLNPNSPYCRSVAEAKYRGLRVLALQVAEADLAAHGVGVSLRSVDAAAIAAVGNWTGRRVAWPWYVMAADWGRKHPSRLEVAVWQDGVLCGVALGRPAPAAAHISLYYLERDPDPANPLRGEFAPAVITPLGAYGVALGKTEMRLVAPLPALVPFYCSPAFGSQVVYQFKEVP